MRLTVSEERHLFDLVICADRPRAETPRLVKLGYVEVSRGGIWGEHARITKKGIEYAKTLPLPKQIELEGAWIAARTSKKYSSTTLDSGSRVATGKAPAALKSGRNLSMSSPKGELTSVLAGRSAPSAAAPRSKPGADVPPVRTSQRRERRQATTSRSKR